MQVKNNGQPLSFDRLISVKFSPLIDIPNTACVKLILFNASERPIIYKFMCETKALITAESNSTGTIPPNGFISCLLIRRREPEINNWRNVKSTSILLITEFKGSNDPNINEHTVTKIKCLISSSALCNSAKPPEEYVTLKSSLDSLLPQNDTSESRVITPLTGVQQLTKKSQDAITINKRQISTNSRKYFNGFDNLEIKGKIIIAIIIVIIILSIQAFFANKSSNGIL